MWHQQACGNDHHILWSNLKLGLIPSAIDCQYWNWFTGTSDTEPQPADHLLKSNSKISKCACPHVICMQLYMQDEPGRSLLCRAFLSTVCMVTLRSVGLLSCEVKQVNTSGCPVAPMLTPDFITQGLLSLAVQSGNWLWLGTGGALVRWSISGDLCRHSPYRTIDIQIHWTCLSVCLYWDGLGLFKVVAGRWRSPSCLGRCLHVWRCPWCSGVQSTASTVVRTWCYTEWWFQRQIRTAGRHLQNLFYIYRQTTLWLQVNNILFMTFVNYFVGICSKVGHLS